MLQIDEDDKYRSAGMKFNAYIVALLNAALVEEMAEYGIPNMNFNVIGDIDVYKRQMLICLLIKSHWLAVNIN